MSDEQLHATVGERSAWTETANGQAPGATSRPARRRVTRQVDPPGGDNAARPALTPAPAREPDIWDHRVANGLAFLRRRLTGDYEVDEFGFDPDLTDQVFQPILRLLYERYFRIEVVGEENIPAEGGALIVANHAGTLPLDALMLSIAVHDEHPAGRHLRLLAADLALRMPILSELGRKYGMTLACNPDAERLMNSGELVGVFPEGYKGLGKGYAQRYKLQRFGRGGFVSAALRTRTPIIPVAIVGSEEIYPMIADLKPVARVAGTPYFPVTPTFPLLGPLGLMPLPSKWLIAFGEPIETASYDGEADDPIVVFNLADQVRETIQETLHTLLSRRPDPFADTAT
ncbi:lysophospholipid acyltransferase family protein [Luedemannella flava]|uniref:Lysophospholipid acyltransferase family protein n=1 Tax=Luedemannella flava TaxID=349316 RepID=A0ABP4YUN0_9ACTN